MSSHMDSLMMTIGLIDQASAPLQGIQSSITQTADAGRIGWDKMAGGTAGLVAAGFAVQSALMPAIEMDRVLGEVKSLGVVDADLQKLQQTALGFSAEYGKSATEVVEAAYDIKSAFGNINGDELADITKSSAVLAAATKADTATITDYMGTMYGVFKNQADDMGTGIWSKQVAGMTAQSVEMFKTTGKGMSDAFTSVGANATSAGISMNEQMAILGTLQSTMSGAEAGTKYKSFLDGVGKAQDKLNMKFTDSQGAMLPMHDILGKLKNEFGDTLDVAESDALKNAFGSAEAVSMIKLLMADTDGLASSIETLGDVKGMGKAESMAGAMTDQWERLDASWYAIRAGVFGLVLPAINGLVGGMADGIGSILEWTQLFPNITEYLGYAALAIVGGAGAIAAWNLIVGLSTLVTAGWGSAVVIMSSVMAVASTGLTWMKGAFIGLNMIMAANPVLLIVAGILALGIAVIGIIVYWDELTAALNKIWIFNQIGQMFKAVGGSVMSVINDLVLAWDIFTLALLNTGFMQGIMSGFNTLSNFFSGLFDGYVAIASGAWALIGAGVDALLLPFQVVFTSIKAFFSLLIDGPAAALSVLGTIPALFTGIADSVMSAWQLIASGVSTVVSHLFSVILFLAQPFILVGQQAMMVFGLMAQGWTDFTDYLGDLSVFELLGDGINWLIEKINMIPGIEIEPLVKEPLIPDVESMNIGNQKANSERINRPISSYLQGTQTAQVPTYGYMPQMAKAMQGNGGKSTHTGDIHIKQEQPFTRAQLHEWNEMDTP
ncbi:phage tail tape measure protein [Moritella viscosa]|nr:phage tail tape measure protein [Moritella viscosa]SGY96128.1 Probable tail length determinator [Moritella viscosa]SHO28073.1 Probable tail length determinator [Moritella viscosa]